MSYDLSQPLTNYVKDWNRYNTPKLIYVGTEDFGHKILTAETNYTLLNITFISGRCRGIIDISKLIDGLTMDSKVGHKFITELCQLSWQWNPPSLRSIILNPAVEQFNRNFPRWGYQLDSESIVWLDDSSREECIDIIRISQYISTAIVYYQESALAEPRSVYVRPSPLKLRSKSVVSQDFSKIDDEVAGVGEPICCVCMTNKPCVAAKCGHLSSCASCTQKISSTPNPKCPKCRGPWINLQRIFL